MLHCLTLVETVIRQLELTCLDINVGHREMVTISVRDWIRSGLRGWGMWLIKNFYRQFDNGVTKAYRKRASLAEKQSKFSALAATRARPVGKSW